jgi:hypothetical protein
MRGKAPPLPPPPAAVDPTRQVLLVVVGVVEAGMVGHARWSS